MTLELLKMLCRDYNLHLCLVFSCAAVSNAILLLNARNDRRYNKREFEYVYREIDTDRKKIEGVESGLKEVARGQVETDKKVVEVLHEIREAKIKLEEKFRRYHAEREETEDKERECHIGCGQTETT
jgi:septal ring factor EnvC (AmiA/AmiB activator)